METDTSGNLGVKQATPAAPLHVGGEAIIGNTGLSCSATTVGALRYNSVVNNIEFCDGANWLFLAAGSSACSAPSGLSFTNVTGATLSTVYTSDTATITFSGCSTGQSVSVSGGASPQISINGGSWTTSGVIYSGQTLAVRQTSSASGSTVVTATVTIGSSSANWTVTTAALDPCTGTASSPSIGDVCTDGSIYAGLTPDGNVPMYTMRCDVGQSWSGSACTGTRATKKWSYGMTVTTGYTSYTTGKTNTANEYGLNGNADGPYEAATYCYTLNYLGHTDWYLPAIGELNVLYTNKNAIGNFDTSGSYYWSSSEIDFDGVRGERFSDGDQSDVNYKNYLLPIRCARR